MQLTFNCLNEDHQIFLRRRTYVYKEFPKIDLKSLIYGHCFPTVSHLAKEATTTDFFNVSLHLWKTLLMRREVCLTSHQYNDISNVFHFKNIKIVSIQNDFQMYKSSNLPFTDCCVLSYELFSNQSA